MKLIQHKLVSGNTHLLTWLPQDQRVKIGTLLTLDDEPEIWTVEWQSEVAFVGEFNRKWGLELPTRVMESSMGLKHGVYSATGSMGIADPPDSDDPVLTWERKRAQEVVAYVSNKLIGIHLTPDEARTIYNRLVASTWPDDGTLKWPPAPKSVALGKLETERRIKE